MARRRRIERPDHDDYTGLVAYHQQEANREYKRARRSERMAADAEATANLVDSDVRWWAKRGDQGQAAKRAQDATCWRRIAAIYRHAAERERDNARRANASARFYRDLDAKRRARWAQLDTPTTTSQEAC